MEINSLRHKYQPSLRGLLPIHAMALSVGEFTSDSSFLLACRCVVLQMLRVKKALERDQEQRVRECNQKLYHNHPSLLYLIPSTQLSASGYSGRMMVPCSRGWDVCFLMWIILARNTYTQIQLLKLAALKSNLSKINKSHVILLQVTLIHICWLNLQLLCWSSLALNSFALLILIDLEFLYIGDVVEMLRLVATVRYL